MAERNHQQKIRVLFGSDASIRETSGTVKQPRVVEIRSGSALLGSGKTFAGALADALSFQLPGVHRASDIPTTF